MLAWEPPHRLVLAWQITAEWKYDATFITEIEVTFTREGPNATRVALEHRDLHRYGLKAAEYRKLLDSQEGWGVTLERFAAAAADA